jgi:hypothetical protein
MTDSESRNTKTSDEIDLGQFFHLIGNGFRSIFTGILRGFLFVKGNFFWFLGLIILGWVTGFLVNKLGEQKYQQEVIVTPGLITGNYLYDVVAELQASLEFRDTVFFNSIGIDLSKTPNFKMEIAALRTDSKDEASEDRELIKLLGTLGESETFSELIKGELMAKTTRDHRVTFFYKDPEYGVIWAQKIINYINSNTYYGAILDTEIENAKDRILKNDSLAHQIDRLVDSYTKKLGTENPGTEGRLVLESQEALDISSLIEQRKGLIINTEIKKLELDQKKGIITVVNFGKPHAILKPLFRKNLVFFPLVYIGLFLLVTLIRYLNQRAEQLN